MTLFVAGYIAPTLKQAEAWAFSKMEQDGPTFECERRTLATTDAMGKTVMTAVIEPIGNAFRATLTGRHVLTIDEYNTYVRTFNHRYTEPT